MHFKQSFTFADLYQKKKNKGAENSQTASSKGACLSWTCEFWL